MGGISGNVSILVWPCSPSFRPLKVGPLTVLTGCTNKWNWLVGQFELIVTEDQLSEPNLSGAEMPDGSIHG